MAERLALPTSDHGVAGSNPAGGEILPEPNRRFIAQSLSCSPFHRLEMTEILLKGRKTLTHPSIILSQKLLHLGEHCMVCGMRIIIISKAIRDDLDAFHKNHFTGSGSSVVLPSDPERGFLAGTYQI